MKVVIKQFNKKDISKDPEDSYYVNYEIIVYEDIFIVYQDFWLFEKETELDLWMDGFLTASNLNKTQVIVENIDETTPI